MAPDNLFDSLLAQSRGLVTERLSGALAAMMEHADKALLDSLGQPGSLEGAFRACYLAEFARRCDRARNIHAELSDTDASLELALVGEEDLNETLRFSEMAARLRRYCDEELAALDQRAGVLLGDANLQAEANPFSPQAICEAYKEACRQAAEGATARGALLKLFDDHVVDELRSVYKAVNALLVEQGILPKIRYSVRAQREKEKAEAAAEAAPAQDFFAVLQNLLPAKGAGPGAGAGGGPLVQGPELLSALSGLQVQFESGEAGMVNRLRELKGTSLGASMGQMDAMTLDIVTMLFDQLFDDPKIPLGAKALIGRLQMPVLKAAIADKALFSNKEHPARRLLDTLGEIAARLPADFNTTSPLFWQLEMIVQELIGGESAEAGVFDSVRERCIALMAEEDARVEREAQARADEIQREEALAVAKAVAQEQVGARVQASQLPGAVLEFLVEHWLKLLLIIHVKRGAESEPWKTALDAMDQLIWSVQPKTTAEERRRLGATVPGLLKRLTAGLQVLGVADTVREEFFAALMNVHTQVLAGNGQSSAARDRASQMTSFSASIVVRNPFGAGEVKVGELDGAGAGVPASLTVGIWAELRDGEKRQPARLIFISPKKTRYFFVDRTGKNYIEYTRAEISRRLRSGEVTVMDEMPEVPLFERIMRNVVGKMRGAAA